MSPEDRSHLVRLMAEDLEEQVARYRKALSENGNYLAMAGYTVGHNDLCTCTSVLRMITHLRNELLALKEEIDGADDTNGAR